VEGGKLHTRSNNEQGGGRGETSVIIGRSDLSKKDRNPRCSKTSAAHIARNSEDSIFLLCEIKASYVPAARAYSFVISAGSCRLGPTSDLRLGAASVPLLLANFLSSLHNLCPCILFVTPVRIGHGKDARGANSYYSEVMR
jgi:hypothetical protein